MNTAFLTPDSTSLARPAERTLSAPLRPSRALLPAIALLCAISAAACTSTGDAPVRPANVADFSPAPSQLLEPGDELEIKFRYTPELDERQAIQPDGTVSMPLIGEVGASGMTVSQFRQELLDRYATQLRDPELIVVVRSQPSNQVYVTGEVNKVGPQPATPVLTVSQAIVAAQGLKVTARSGEVLVIRTNKDNAREVRSVDVAAILDGEAASQDVKLQARDIVYVPSSVIADANNFVEQYIRNMLPITPSVAIVPPL